MAKVPKFGEWENNNDAMYTVCFDNARTKRGQGKPAMDPNDPPLKTPSSSSTSRGDRVVRPNATNNPHPKHKPGQEFQSSEKVQQQRARQIHPNSPSPATSSYAKPESSTRRVSPRPNAVPKFGEWENSSSAPGEGYTVVFNKVREQVKEIKNGENGNVQANNCRNHDTKTSQTKNESSILNNKKNESSTNPSCFGCLFKR